MSATETAETVIARKARRDWWQVVSVAVIIGLLLWITWDKAAASERALVAEANALTFAQEVQAACASDPALVKDYSICIRADAVADQPIGPSAPTVAERGQDGERGLTGPVSTVPGPMGPQGLAGLVSTVPGPQGEASMVPGPRGEEGAASIVPGPQGEASTVPGPAGVGLASLTCQEDGTWLVTLTDGATSTTPGLCRVDIVAPRVEPVMP